MMYYKLLTISYEDSLVAVGGSANMTKAAWSRNDEFVFYVEGPAGECSRFNSLEKCVRTTPSDLAVTKGNRYSREPTENGSQNTPDTQNNHDTQDSDGRDTADTMAIDDENTADNTQALVQPSWWNDWAQPKTRRHFGHDGYQVNTCIR
ncbi:hypothetical protein GQ600_20112 [Phytophthora cactorum]|nr:hypothetical protein GQ600_20112 [Phytophthora cactorum]